MRKRPRLLWQLYPSHLLMIVLSLAAMGGFSYKALKQVWEDKIVTELRSQALLVARLATGKISPAPAADLDAVVKEIGKNASVRITIVDRSGTVLADSLGDPPRMDSHAVRPEIKRALKGEIADTMRHSFSLNTDMIYVAMPLEQDGGIVGAVRLAQPVSPPARFLRPFWNEIFWAALVIVTYGGLMTLYVSSRISKPLRSIREGATRFAGGDLQYRLDVPSSEEFADLAEAMNAMAAQLNARISTVVEQRNELEGVLSGMVEAVLVVDTNERVLRVNQAAEKLFNIDARKVANRTVHEVIRNTDFHSFVSKTLSAESPVEGEIVILGDPDSYLQAHGVTLRNEAGQCIGGLVVIHDVTRLKNLENIRRDFVANVSHELKTPVTSIKGFLETLREGAFQDPQHAERFLDIIIRHTDRLSAIIEDLLSLSRIERYAEKGGINFEVGAIRSVFDSVSKICAVRAEAKGVSLDFVVDEAVSARMNAPLLEQALVNLVDNAIKFSESGSAVKVSARQSADGISIHVEDQGCGIAKEQLPRIFERFYRVDKGRSRAAGGTGLGLSIVKHIAVVHGGNVTVKSSPGRGSTFTVHLPAIARNANG